MFSALIVTCMAGFCVTDDLEVASYSIPGCLMQAYPVAVQYMEDHPGRKFKKIFCTNSNRVHFYLKGKSV